LEINKADNTWNIGGDDEKTISCLLTNTPARKEENANDI
jgi:hypothetical protein